MSTLLSISVFFANFIDYRVWKFSIADLAIILLVLLSLPRFRVRKIKITRCEVVGLSLMAVGLLLSLVLNLGKDFFSLFDYLMSSAKLVLYLVAIYTVPDLLRKNKVKCVKIIESFILFAVASGLLQLLIILIFGRDSWPLYSLGSHFFDITSEDTLFTVQGLIRIRSFYAEPAHFAVHISMLYGLLLFGEKPLKTVTHIAYIVGIISTSTVSGFAIMAGIYTLFGIKYLARKRSKKAIISVSVGFAALTGLIFATRPVRERIIDLFRLEDTSGVVRTVGGFLFLKYSPWYGTGPGNNVNFFHSLPSIPELDKNWFEPSGEFFNNILLAIIILGYIGGLGFLVYQFAVLKQHKLLFLVLTAVNFGWGKLFDVPIWFFLLLYIAIYDPYGDREECLWLARKNPKTSKNQG